MRKRVLACGLRPDERDKQYPIRRGVATRTVRYWWDSGWWGDQGLTSQCVGYAWRHWLCDGPVTHPRGVEVPKPSLIYQDAKKVDEWPGEAYEGTSVRAGAKVLQSRGYIQEYRWAQDLHQAINALLTQGPLVIGSWWYSGMWEPDKRGFISALGTREGGHAYVVNGINLPKNKVRIKNSWGRDWGLKGHAWMSLECLDRLIAEDGELCLAVELR